MNGTKSILDRISNLISSDSKILKDYDTKMESSNKTKSKAEDEKRNYESEITKIQSDIDEISKASELSDRFSNLESYKLGLEKLGKAVSLLDSLKEELNKIPEQIESLENKIKNLTEESDNRTKLIQDAEDEISKLEVEKSDAKRYQDNLIELVNLAKTGNINKTREEVVETLIHVGFSDKEAIAAAKVILFPEDELIPYFNKSTSNSTITPEENVEEEIPQDVAVPAEDEFVPEENQQEEVIEENAIQEEIENPASQEEENQEVNGETKEESNEIINEIQKEIDNESNDIPIDEQISEISLDSMDEDIKLNPVDVASNKDIDGIKKILSDYGFDLSMFTDEDLDEDEETVRNNINFILEKNLNKNFVYEYPNVISDRTLKDKYELIIKELNKTEEDISLTPEIIASYSKDDLEKLFEVSSQSGVDPKLIPLAVYLKGLQPFLRNYLVLKDNGIELDDNQLSKFAIILAINPVDFKKSLQILLDYKVDLKKSDGKYAIMDLAVKDSELANKMDMIINIGEEDLLKYYPEVLSTDVKELVNRLIFLKKSQIPYKTQSHNKVVYQSFVLKQEILDKVLEKHIEINEVLDKDETNNNLKDIIKNEEIINELNNINDNFEFVNNPYLEDYKVVLKDIKGKYKESDFSYIVGNYCFSKNKVNRDINYLLSTFTGIDKEIIILASLLHDSRLSKQDMENVQNILGIKVK